jgi:hypothetical protein
MKIARASNCDITVSKPTFIINLLAKNGLIDCNSSPTPDIGGHDTSKTTENDILSDTATF